METKEWYKDYEKKKTFSYQLNQKGIRGSGEVERALTCLLLYKKLRPYVDLGGYGNSCKNLLKVRFEAVTREMDSAHSIVSSDWIIKKVDGLLGLRDSLYNKRNALQYSFRAKIPKDKLEAYENRLKEEIKILEKELRDTLDEQKELIRLYISYMEIGNPHQRKFIEELCEKYKINLYGDEQNE